MKRDQRPALGAVVLVAGKSSRMGRNKILLKFGASTVLQTIVETVKECELSDVVYVTGHEAEEVESVLALNGQRFIRNREYETGLHSSIKAGLRELDSGLDGFFVFLGDQPDLHRSTVRDLSAAFTANKDHSLFAPEFNGERGHPVLISMKHKTQIMETSGGDRGCHYLFQRYPDEVFKINAQSELRDIDTLEDYRRVTGELDFGS